MNTNDFDSFRELLDACRLEAINGILNPTQETIYRSMCRDYSERFHTPLHVVHTLDMEFVITELYSAQFDDRQSKEDWVLEDDLGSLMEMVARIEDPEFEAHEKEEFDEFAEQALAEERERLKAKRPIHKALAKEMEEPTLSPRVAKPEQPSQGFINLSHLDNEDNR